MVCSNTFSIAWAMTVLPFPGGPYSKMVRPEFTAGPTSLTSSWGMTKWVKHSASASGRICSLAISCF